MSDLWSLNFSFPGVDRWRLYTYWPFQSLAVCVHDLIQQRQNVLHEMTKTEGGSSEQYILQEIFYKVKTLPIKT